MLCDPVFITKNGGNNPQNSLPQLLQMEQEARHE